MSDKPLTTAELFRKYGKPLPTPNVGQRVLIERGGKTDEPAFALGEVISTEAGGGQREGRVVVKEQAVYFADGRVTTPHRSPVTLPFNHFAKPIQERLRERAERLATAAEQYRQWAQMPT